MVIKLISGIANSNTAPIKLRAGDVVLLGEKFEDDKTWPDWIHCISKRTEKRWTPIQLLQIDRDSGIAKCDYTAKEMSVAAGDMVSSNDELNIWIWCIRKSDDQSGWLPKNHQKNSNKPFTPYHLSTLIDTNGTNTKSINALSIPFS